MTVFAFFVFCFRFELVKTKAYFRAKCVKSDKTQLGRDDKSGVTGFR